MKLENVRINRTEFVYAIDENPLIAKGMSIEFLDYISYPFNLYVPAKLVDMLDLGVGKLTAENIKAVDFTFNGICLSLENARMLYDYRLAFDETQVRN
mmetsp:Transcript_23540/g.27009  ORF Transcript_23540/g.27009 Transcript_23540/m.27009 type:complete len:98 (+) Transcript_23540:455-748(+)